MTGTYFQAYVVRCGQAGDVYKRQKPTESVFEDVEVAPLLRSLLTEYLEERGICLLYTSALLGLTEKEKSQILSLNMANNPSRLYKAVWIGLGGTQSAVYATEVSACLLYTSLGFLPDLLFLFSFILLWI